MSKKTITIMAILILLLTVAIYFWFFFMNNNEPGVTVEPLQPVVFNPLTPPTPTPTTGASTTVAVGPTAPVQGERLPVLRHLSMTPIGGYVASTSASTTLVRYVDRGAGHVYEATDIKSVIDKISNTTIPRIYESYWNRNANAAILRYIREGENTISNFYAEIRQSATSSDPDTTPYEIKGRFLSPAIREIAVSPKADKIFTFNIEEGKGIGYTSGFDESKKTRVLDTPLTQVNTEWPEENTVAITTKASGLSSGYLYFLDLKKGGFTKILGEIIGLTTKTSADARKVLFSTGSASNMVTAIYNTKDSTTQEVVFRTLAEKCVWSKLYPDDIYCAVPTEIPAGLYPDDWYKGNVSFIDQIWHLDTATGEVHLIANLLNLSNDLVDATNLALDPFENYLYFVNKRDLTLWSLYLNN